MHDWNYTKVSARAQQQLRSRVVQLGFQTYHSDTGRKKAHKAHLWWRRLCCFRCLQFDHQLLATVRSQAQPLPTQLCLSPKLTGCDFKHQKRSETKPDHTSGGAAFAAFGASSLTTSFCAWETYRRMADKQVLHFFVAVSDTECCDTC
jgi:hypothetical protein